MAKTKTETTPTHTATHAAADANRRKLIAELADVDRQIAAVNEQRRMVGRVQPGENLVVGLPVQQLPDLPDAAPLITRRRDLESAIKLQSDVLRNIHGAMSRELSVVNAPQAREKLLTALRAMIAARAALQDYKQFVAKLTVDFSVTAPIPEVGIDPDLFGPDNSALSSLIARTKEALGIED